MSDNASFASKVWSDDGHTDLSAETPFVDMHDAAQFRQWLHEGVGETPTVGDRAPFSVADALNSVSRSLREKEGAFNKALERTARSGDPVEGLAVQQTLSDLYLEHGLATKVIAKTTSAIESLMKMQ